MSTTPPFVPVIDTREQRPLLFPVPSVRRTLDAGDYAILGIHNKGDNILLAERKDPGDMVNTFLYRREQFDRVLGELAKCRWKLIVIEATGGQIVRGKYHSKAHPNSVIGLLAGAFADHGVPWALCESPYYTARFLYSFMGAAIRRMKDNDEHDLLARIARKPTEEPEGGIEA